MGKHQKLIQQILGGRTDSNIRFDELRALLTHLGFTERTRGSHHNFRQAGLEEKLNLQSDGNKAKAYQVRQVRNVILKYQLGANE